nr:sigma factor [Clostridium yunnanense]
MLNSSRLNKALEITDDVRLAKKGNKEAFCRIIETNKDQLYRIAKGIVNYEADIEDVLQEVTLKAWLQINKLKINLKVYQ